MATNIISKEEILSFLRKNKTLLKEKYDVDEIMLFGSHKFLSRKPLNSFGGGSDALLC